MNRMLPFTMLITIPGIVAIGATAQAASPASPNAVRTTVVGCLTNASSQPSSPIFMITNTGSGTVATSGNSKGESDSAGYRLEASAFLHKMSGDYENLYPTDYKRLNREIGHKVEVVGTVQGQKNGVASDAGSNERSLELQEINVESFKVLSSTCSQ